MINTQKMATDNRLLSPALGIPIPLKVVTLAERYRSLGGPCRRDYYKIMLNLTGQGMLIYGRQEVTTRPRITGSRPHSYEMFHQELFAQTINVLREVVF